jgi:hypothetical protein
VAQNGHALRHASAALQADRDFVLAAVAQNGDALKFASAALQADLAAGRQPLPDPPAVASAAAAASSAAVLAASPAPPPSSAPATASSAAPPAHRGAASSAQSASVIAKLKAENAGLRAQLPLPRKVIDLTNDAPATKRHKPNKAPSALALVVEINDMARKRIATVKHESASAAAAAADKLEDEKDKALCALCEVQPRSVVCTPCNHFAMCGACADDPRATVNGCPICRIPIASLLRGVIVS